MSWVLIGIVVVVVLLVIYVIALYNGLVQKRNRVDNAWAQIEVQLKRRHDLIPNLVETVKGYAAHERGTFEAVTQARAAAVGAQGPAQTAAAEGILSQALGRLFAVAEAYPDLKASTNFLDLQQQLQDTENKIAVSRQVYNDTVLTFNNAIQVFPAVLIAGPFGFTRREFFEIEDAADREVPAVSFEPAAPAAPEAPVAPAAPPAGDAPAPPSDLALSSSQRRSPHLRSRGRPARSRSRLPQAAISVQVAKDGSLARRRAHHLRLHAGRSAAATARSRSATASRSTDVRVTEDGRAYRPGGCTELGCIDAAGTYGTTDGRRLAPHRLALRGHRRAPHVHGPLPAEGPRRRLRRRRRRQPQGLGLRVGGAARPAHRDARSRPGKVLRAWGHPVYVRGDVQLLGTKVLLRALDVPAGQFVELRTVIPRTAFTSTAGHAGRRGRRPARRSSPRRRPTPPRSRRTSERIEHAKAHPWRYAPLPAPARHDPGVPRRRRRSSGSTAASGRPATTASTSRSRRPTPSRRSCRRCCARAARRARSSSRRPSST